VKLHSTLDETILLILKANACYFLCSQVRQNTVLQNTLEPTHESSSVQYLLWKRLSRILFPIPSDILLAPQEFNSSKQIDYRFPTANFSAFWLKGPSLLLHATAIYCPTAALSLSWFTTFNSFSSAAALLIMAKWACTYTHLADSPSVICGVLWSAGDCVCNKFVRLLYYAFDSWRWVGRLWKE